MPRRSRPALPVAAWLGGLVAFAAVIADGRDLETPDSSGAPRALVEAVNEIVAADIPIAAAQCVTCSLERLPGSRAALLPLVPNDHRRLIQECARGRTRFLRHLAGFNLLALIDEPEEAPTAALKIRGFFDERAVEVAVGRAHSDGPYPISFDWAVVLDPRSRTLFSFVFNCRD